MFETINLLIRKRYQLTTSLYTGLETCNILLKTNINIFLKIPIPTRETIENSRYFPKIGIQIGKGNFASGRDREWISGSRAEQDPDPDSGLATLICTKLHIEIVRNMFPAND